MGFFRRRRSAVEVRVLEVLSEGRRIRRPADGREERSRLLRLELGAGDEAQTVEADLWVPLWVGLPQLVSSGRVLRGTVTGAGGEGLEIDWEQIEEDVSADVFAKLFHKQGPPEERLALLEDLHARGQFTEELYGKARRELLAEMGEPPAG